MQHEGARGGSVRGQLLWRVQTGQPITAGRWTIRPQSRAIRVCWPRGGFLWNRPVAVLVEGEGVTRRLPIHERTRIVHLVLRAGGIAASTLAGP